MQFYQHKNFNIKVNTENRMVQLHIRGMKPLIYGFDEGPKFLRTLSNNSFETLQQKLNDSSLSRRIIAEVAIIYLKLKDVHAAIAVAKHGKAGSCRQLSTKSMEKLAIDELDGSSAIETSTDQVDDNPGIVGEMQLLQIVSHQSFDRWM